jgi:translation initiation factor 4E
MSGDKESEENTQAAVVAPLEDPEKEHPLHTGWTLWYNGAPKKGKGGQTDWSVTKILPFNTVENFWRLYNNIARPSQLATGSNYHFFKTGIQPEWEDKANQNGGKWILNLPRTKKAGTNEIVDEAWLWTLLSLIGEFFEDGDDIKGVVISPRKGTNRLALWTGDASNEDLVLRIGRKFKNCLIAHLKKEGAQMLELEATYQAHNDALRNKSSFRNKNRFNI